MWVDLAGVRTKVALFTLRLSYSGKAVHRVFPTQGQEAFLEGHVHAFEALGGLPVGKIRYDNLKVAVARVTFGRTPTDTIRWVASDRTTVSTRSTASPVSRARMRRAAWRARGAGSAAPTLQRNTALPGWLHFYNHHRAHSAIGGKPPITRRTNVLGQHAR